MSSRFPRPFRAAFLSLCRTHRLVPCPLDGPLDGSRRRASPFRPGHSCLRPPVFSLSSTLQSDGSRCRFHWCTLCKLPITQAHAQADCPLLFLITWFLCIKLSHLLPVLNPSWHKCLPTPWGTLLATPTGHLVSTVNPIKYMRMPHDLCIINLTGEVSSHSMHQAAEHGASNTMMTRVLGFLLTTWYKVQHIKFNCV